MRINQTVDRMAALRARVGWMRDLFHELLGERYREIQRPQAEAFDFEDLGQACREAALKAEWGKSPVPFVEAAKNLIRTVASLDDVERRDEPLESLARRVRSWEKFKRTARQWCERHCRR